MAGFRIRRAEEHRDWRALRMLLPEAIHHGCGCEAFVATDDAASRRVIGAVATTPHMRSEPRRGPKVAIHVIEPWRRRGVGRGLLNTAMSAAAVQSAEALYAWHRMRPDAKEAQTWRALGFDQAIDCPLCRIDGKRAVELLEPLFERLQQRGGIPPEARIVGLEAARADEIVELITRYLGASREALKRCLTGKHPEPMDPTLSRVLLYREQVVGVIMGRAVDDHVAWVESDVLHPLVRGRWANVWLKLEALRQAQDLGFDTFIYQAYQRHTDTLKFTQRLGGILMPRIELYRNIISLPAK